MGPLDETVIFRVVLSDWAWERQLAERGKAGQDVGAINWLMGRGVGHADALDGGVWASALSWLGEGATGWPDKDIAVGPVGALLGPGAKELVMQMLYVLYGDATAAEVNAVLEGELRATNVLFSNVPAWYLSMNYVLTGHGVRRASHSLVVELRALHTSAMPPNRSAAFHEIAPDKPVSSDTKMFRWLEQVAGMGLTYGLHVVLARDQSRQVWVNPPMFIVAGTAAVSFGRTIYAAMPSVPNDHEWVILPCLRDSAGLLTVREDTLRNYETPRFLATTRRSTSPDGRLLLGTSSLLSSPRVILQQSKGISVGIIKDGPYQWDCTAYADETIHVQRLSAVNKAGGVWESNRRTKVLHTHAPGMVEIKHGTRFVYSPPKAAWPSLVLDGASTLYTVALAVLVVSTAISRWGRATFAIEIVAAIGSRISAVIAWSRSPGRGGTGLVGVVTALFAPIHWVLRNPGQDAEVDGRLWRAPLRFEAWGGLLSLGPLAAAVSLEEVSSYQVALLAVVSTIVIGSLRFNELWEELVGLPRVQSAGVCASYALMYICGLLVQSSFLIAGNSSWWAIFGVVFGVGKTLTAVRSAVIWIKALEAVCKGRGKVLHVALASGGGLLGALTMSGISPYGDLWDWNILALEEEDGVLSWSSAAKVKYVAGGDFRGLSFKEIGIPDENMQLLCAQCNGHTPAATHIMARSYRTPSEEAVVEVMPGVGSGEEVARCSGVHADYNPMLAVRVGSFYLPVAMAKQTAVLE